MIVNSGLCLHYGVMTVVRKAQPGEAGPAAACGGCGTGRHAHGVRSGSGTGRCPRVA
jgi:hypothetical protein